MAATPIIDPNEISPAACVANNLRKITRTVVQAYEDALRPSGITISQFSTLGTLNQTGPISMLRLAEAMELDRTTLARNLKPLERDGLVAITPNESDRRAKVIQITQAGGQALEKAAPLWQSVQQQFVNGLGTTELNTLFQTIGHLRELAHTE